MKTVMDSSKAVTPVRMVITDEERGACFKAARNDYLLPAKAAREGTLFSTMTGEDLSGMLYNRL